MSVTLKWIILSKIFTAGGNIGMLIESMPSLASNHFALLENHLYLALKLDEKLLWLVIVHFVILSSLKQIRSQLRIKSSEVA